MHCHIPTVAAAASLFVNMAFAQTPAGFSPSSSGSIVLSYGNTTVSPPGTLLPIDVPAAQPIVTSPTSLPGTYLLLAVDPDAPTPQNPNISQYLHWLQPGVTFSTAAPYTAQVPSSAIAPYVRPGPPNYSIPHRYIFLLFAQPANFSVPADFKKFNAKTRMMFNASLFVSEAGLGSAIAADYFLCGNMTMSGTATSTGSVPIFTGGAAATVLSWGAMVGAAITAAMTAAMLVL